MFRYVFQRSDTSVDPEQGRTWEVLFAGSHQRYFKFSADPKQVVLVTLLCWSKERKEESQLLPSQLSNKRQKYLDSQCKRKALVWKNWKVPACTFQLCRLWVRPWVLLSDPLMNWRIYTSTHTPARCT